MAVGALSSALVIVVAGWLLWSVFRPPPEGFSPTVGEAVRIPEGPANLFEYTIDARSRGTWVFFSFERGAGVSSRLDAVDWDLAFKRTDMLTNGGATNPAGDGAAADLGKVPLLEARPPADGYESDIQVEEEVENPALDKWYAYDWLTHTVNSRNRTYAVRTVTGKPALVTFLSYYCEDGSPACVTFRYLYPLEQTSVQQRPVESPSQLP